MKTIILNIAMTCGLLFGSFSLFAQEVTNGPQIFAEKETHDFGDIAHQGNGNYTFTVKNTGNQPLIIDQVKPSCSCSVSDWNKEPIPPGETTEIKVKYDTNRVGPINKSFTVISNAVNAPTMMLKIKGTVLPAKETAAEAIPGEVNRN